MGFGKGFRGLGFQRFRGLGFGVGGFGLWGFKVLRV